MLVSIQDTSLSTKILLGLWSMALKSMCSLFAAFTMFVGITFPFFSGLLSFFGGFAFAPTTYFVSTGLLADCNSIY